MSDFSFRHDERMGISIPELEKDWDEYSDRERGEILAQWEPHCGRIPQRIKDLEQHIVRKQAMLDGEENFPVSCQINWEIADLAAAINDLHLWFRLYQSLSSESAASRMHS